MRVNLDAPAGTLLLLLAGEWFPTPAAPADRDELVTVVAVGREEIAGRVWVNGHTCRRTDPDCGTEACFQHQVLTAAILANLAGAR